MIGLLIGLILATIVCGIVGKRLYNGYIYYDWKDYLGMVLMFVAVICFAFSIVVFVKII